MNAGTSTPRTTVASMRTMAAIVVPSTTSRLTWESISAPMLTATTSAAVVNSRPVCSIPKTMAAVFCPVRRHSSAMRETRKTS